jgi:hypothetical protein
MAEGAPQPPQSAITAPADKPGPKPGISGKRRACELADEILADEKLRPTYRHGWRTTLAQLIQNRLSVEGHAYRLDSVKRTLRENKITHPEETG